MQNLEQREEKTWDPKYKEGLATKKHINLLKKLLFSE